MAFTTYGNLDASATLADRFGAFITDLREARAKRRVYRTTLNELSSLSNRELADLGIARGEVRNIAMQAAYGR